MGPFKKTFKNSLSLTVTLPNSFVHSRNFINLVHLFHRSITDKVSVIDKIFSNYNSYSPKLLLEHRLHAIKEDLHIQTSPLILNNFSAFSRTFRFRTDFLFRLLSFASELGISFAKPFLPPQNLIITRHNSIYDLFHYTLSVYAKNMYLFKK